MSSEEIMRIATDVGGTFTDLVYLKQGADGTQIIGTAKSDTTPPNFEQGVMDVFHQAEIDAASVDFFAHGTTVIINALTERKGAKTALITTEGFRDILEIAREIDPISLIWTIESLNRLYHATCGGNYQVGCHIREKRFTLWT